MLYYVRIYTCGGRLQPLFVGFFQYDATPLSTWFFGKISTRHAWCLFLLQKPVIMTTRPSGTIDGAPAKRCGDTTAGRNYQRYWLTVGIPRISTPYTGWHGMIATFVSFCWGLCMDNKRNTHTLSLERAFASLAKERIQNSKGDCIDNDTRTITGLHEERHPPSMCVLFRSKLSIMIVVNLRRPHEHTY